jgi:hypothetical protein
MGHSSNSASFPCHWVAQSSHRHSSASCMFLSMDIRSDRAYYFHGCDVGSRVKKLGAKSSRVSADNGVEWDSGIR